MRLQDLHRCRHNNSRLWNVWVSEKGKHIPFALAFSHANNAESSQLAQRLASTSACPTSLLGLSKARLLLVEFRIHPCGPRPTPSPGTMQRLNQNWAASCEHHQQQEPEGFVSEEPLGRAELTCPEWHHHQHRYKEDRQPWRQWSEHAKHTRVKPNSRTLIRNDDNNCCCG